MGGYRLYIDIPMPFGESRAIEFAEDVISSCFASERGRELLGKYGLSQVNYRLGHDLDRQKSNHLMKNENGHINNKKCTIVVSDEDPNQNEFEWASGAHC